jgi:hypothetical protein
MGNSARTHKLGQARRKQVGRQEHSNLNIKARDRFAARAS